jgi:hypothetical protein
MRMPNPRRLDLFALSFAAIGTLALVQLGPSTVDRTATDTCRSDRAIDGLIDAEAAAEVGSWWLEETATATALSFDPDHERLVWRVSGHQGGVLLDAETGEPLAFEFDRS